MISRFLHQSLWNPSTFLGAVVYGGTFLAIATVLAQLIRFITNRLSRGHHRYWKDWTVIQFLSQLAQMAIYILCFILYTHIIPSLHLVASVFVTGASLLTIILGLGTQNILGNIAAGVSVLLYRPFQMGDTITVNTPTGHETGQVEKISLSCTIVRIPDGRRVNIPNSVIVSQATIVNDIPVAKTHQELEIKRA